MDTIESKKEVKITGKKEEDLLNTIRDRYKTSVDGWNEIYEDAKADIQFVYDIGEGQWPTTIRSKREKARRPVLTINKLLKFVRQIRGDHLQNRPRIKTIPVDSKSDPAIATLYDDLIRQIEYLSDAHIAYDTAYGHAIAGSIGFFRLITRWSQNNPFEQDIFIKRIVNPFMVHFDPSATEFNYEDARWCFIEDSISKKEFERKYPDADTKNFDTSRRSDSNDWFSEDRVRLAEYFWKEPYTRKMALLSDGSHVQLGNNSEAKIKKDGLQIIKERNVESHRVMWCKTNGYEILEHGEWPGKYIPVIPVLGDEIVIDGKKYYLSLIRGAKDPQRMYNYWSRLSLDTPVPTTHGWKTMGSLEIGDRLFDENGEQCSVLGFSPTFTDKPCFKVTFSNNTSIVSDDEHLWTVKELHDKKWVTKTIHTKELSPEKHRIAIAKPLQLPDVQFPISPYVLGLWISDGDSIRPKVFTHKKTLDEVSDILSKEGMNIRSGSICKASNTYGVALLGIRKEFTRLNLLGNKHVPKEYLRGSFEQRLSLLQGLMDGDGTCKENGICNFATIKESIAKDVSELLSSLGFKGTYYKQADGMYCFSFTPRDFPVFRLKYKKDRQYTERGRTTQSCHYKIVSVERVDSVPVRCVKVDSPNELFLAGVGMIPTHNTSGTETVALTPKSPFIIDKRQIDGFETEWEESNEENRMYIRYNAIAGLQKPSREPQAQIPAAIISMMQTTAYDIEDHLGRYEASKGAPSNERSGRAILARVEQSDRGTFQFIDNLTRAITYCGKQLVDLIPKIYDSERALRIMDESGNQRFVAVNTPVQKSDGSIGTINDLSVGQYDVIASVGLSYGSKREEMVRMLIESMQYAPDLAPAIAPLIFKYSDYPGAEEVYQEIKKATENMKKQEAEDGGIRT